MAAGRRRLLATASQALAVSLGGAAGNQAAWGEAGTALRGELARVLDLHDPGVTWHTLRAPWLALAADAALLAGSMSKIARDIALCAMAEVGELSEPQAPGRGGSTAMPHKRNPVLCMRIIAAVQPIPGVLTGLLQGMPQEQERSLGNWQAELGQVPELFTRACAAAEALDQLLSGLRVNAQRCRANVEALYGTVLSEALAALLVPALGRDDAQSLVALLCEQALERHVHLRDLVANAGDPRLASLAAADVDAVFDLDRACLPSARLVEPLLQQAEALLRPTPA
jgi:3-carboxy-cis,cis-muconate cycloisomerase